MRRRFASTGEALMVVCQWGRRGIVSGSKKFASIGKASPVGANDSPPPAKSSPPLVKTLPVEAKHCKARDH
ncbi:hypothetical protein R1flu_011750 [Riccia fluitans]|uniref:Uncharacterized protein n=1 Tax=Riccia fluitans TaxID=41844 RepID=A0ABD1Z9T6_9MARC